MFRRDYCDPYVIAEIGMNYEGSMARAKEMISAVARAGAHAAKFQTYKAETLASPDSSPAYWDQTKEATPSQYELFRRFDGFGPREYRELADHCALEGVDFLSTPFDLESVDMLATLAPALKIASADLTNVPLLRRAAHTGRPILLSVGASTHAEIDWALHILEDEGATEVALLHCVLRYPTPEADANLLAVRSLREAFGSRASIGYSDHVAPNADGSAPAIIMATALGATVIEKHFTDDRNAVGNDHYHALDEAGLTLFIQSVAQMRQLAGAGEPDIAAQGAAVQNARRRIFVRMDLSAGHILTEDDLIPLRANVGMEIAKWDDVVGKALTRALGAGEAVLRIDIS